ncbi:MAG: TlpA family protein disulfide reductase [Actinomycetota bacterium]
MASEPPEDLATADDPPPAGGTFRDRGPWILRAAIGLVAVAVGAFLLLQPAADEEGDRPRSLPDFELPLLGGSGTLSSADLSGEPIVINFWASWCGPCREETPLLQDMWERYESEGIVILGVDVKDAPASAEDFVEEFGVTYPVVVDEDQRLFKAIAPVDGLPQTFFVDAEGNFLAPAEGAEEGALVLGAIDEDELEAKIRQLLGET